MAFTTNAALNQSTAISIPQADTAYLDIDFFIKRPDLLGKVFDSWDNKGFVDMLALTGREELITSETFSNYESGLLPRSVSFATVTSATAGGAVVTLTGDSMTTVNSATGPVSRSPLKENDIIKLPGRQEAFVQIKSSVNGGASGAATTYTLVKSDNSSDAAFDLGAYLTSVAGSGQRFAITSAAFSEGSYEALEGVETPMVRYTGQLQICKTHSEITGSAAGDRFEIPLANSNGSNYWYSKQRIEQGLNHRMNEGLQMLTGKGGNFIDKNGKKVKTSMGLEGFVRSYGNVYDYASTGFTAADLDALTARIKTIMGGTEYQWIMGSDLYRQVASVIRTLPGLQGGAIRYDMFGKSDASAKALDLGFNSIIWNGITLHLQESPVYNHPELLGLAGYNYTKQGFLIPGAKTRITGSDNGVSTPLMGNMGADADSLRIRYKQDINGRSRRYFSYDRDITTTGFDTTKHEIISHCGLQMVGLRRFILVQMGA
jgi:hypothetical protein